MQIITTFVILNRKISLMKTFILTIYKGHEIKQQKTVAVSSQKELTEEKNGFWSESPYKKNLPKNWMGVKRIR
jgi:hypothetical protein